MNTALGKQFFARSPKIVARQLLGKFLVRQLGDSFLVGRIVETEAYLALDDDACHASRGITRRNATMFGEPGLAYVYAIHSRHCFNVVTERTGRPSAVLIRALEPIAGFSLMAKHRAIPHTPDTQKTEPTATGPIDAGEPRDSSAATVSTAAFQPVWPAKVFRDLARGPGRLCDAFAINRTLDSHDLTQATILWIADTFGHATAVKRAKMERIATSPRIGVTSAKDLLLRYYLANSPYVSSTHKFNTLWSSKA